MWKIQRGLKHLQNHNWYDCYDMPKFNTKNEADNFIIAILEMPNINKFMEFRAIESQ